MAAARRSYVQTARVVGERRATALVIGVPTSRGSRSNVVAVAAGEPPGPAAVLTDAQNAKQSRYDGRTGDTLRIVGAGGRDETVQNLGHRAQPRRRPDGQQADAIVLYATAETVAALSGEPGYSGSHCAFATR